MRRLLLFFFLLPALAGMPRAQDLQAWGYVVWWYPQGWKTVSLGRFERLLLFQFAVQSDGAIKPPPQWPETWPGLRVQAALDDVALDATITLLERTTFLRVFRSAAATQRLLDEATRLALQPGISGLHLDVELYESVDPPALAAFRGFVNDLQSRLRQEGAQRNLSAFIPLGKFRTLYGPAQLNAMDQVVLQGYDAHWDTSPRAGPLAPLDGPYALTWRSALRQADQWGLERRRLLISYPLYGYEWDVKAAGPHAPTTGKARTTSLMPLSPGSVPDIRDSVARQILQYGATFDARSASSYYHYQDQRRQWHEGWFEDGWSLLRKTQFLRQQNVGGIAFFPLGYDDGRLLGTLAPESTDTAPAAH